MHHPTDFVKPLVKHWLKQEIRKEMFYLTTHSTHFIYGYMASDIWLRTILIVRKEIHFRHIGYSFRLAARVLLYAPSHRQDSTYHSLCYTSRGTLTGTRNISIDPSRGIDLTTYCSMSYISVLQVPRSCGISIVFNDFKCLTI